MSCASKTLEENQWEVEALLDEGQKLAPSGRSSQSTSGICFAEFRFPVNVRKVNSFVVMYRPIRLTTFKDVILAPYPDAKQ